MTWVKIDDKAPSHPKLIAAGAEAAWLWLCGLCYCNSYQTDGVIPQGALRALNPGAGWDLRKLKKLAEKLVSVGLWEHCDDTSTTSERPYNVKNYAEYQQAATKLATEERRSANKSRASDWRERQRFSQKEPPSQRYASAEQPTANASPVPARPDQTFKTDNISRLEPLSNGSSDEVVRLLKAGYKQRYEQFAGDVWMAHNANDKKIREVAFYVRNAPGEPADIVNEILDGLFANEKAAVERWPWGWLAMDPGKYRGGTRGDLELDRAKAAYDRALAELTEAGESGRKDLDELIQRKCAASDAVRRIERERINRNHRAAQ